MLVAAAGKPERSMGDSVIPAEPPVWSDVKKIAAELLTDPPHISVLVHLVKASAFVEGFPGMHQAVGLLRDKLEQGWAEVLPVADPDDPDDPYYERVNYLREISEDPGFVSSLQRIPLVDVRGLGAFSLRDIYLSAGKITGSEEELSRCQDGLIRGAFEEVERDLLIQTVEALNGINSLCASLETQFDQQAGAEHGLSFSALSQQIGDCLDQLKTYAGSRIESEPAEFANNESVALESGQTLAEVVPPQTSGAALPDRQAVCQSFDQIILFYQHNEPSSPVPILAQRARDMVTKSFFDVLEDLAPGEKGNLPALLSVLAGNPLAYLVSDSYQRYLNGERIAPADLVNDDSVASDVVESEQYTHSPPPERQQGKLSSRADVMNQLNLIEGYFSQQEPSSPIPLVIAEIRQILPKKFTDLIAEFNRVLNPGEDQGVEES